MDEEYEEWEELTLADLLELGFSVKDCPFCGSGNIHANHRPESMAAYMVCDSCYATGGIKPSLSEMVDGWNWLMVLRASWTTDGWIIEEDERE